MDTIDLEALRGFTQGSPEVIDAVRDVMHEVFKYADIAAPLRSEPPMMQDESLPVRKAAAAQDCIIRNMLYSLATLAALTARRARDAEVEALVANGQRLVGAFRSLGRSEDIVTAHRTRRECEESIVAFDAALLPFAGAKP